MWSGVWRGVPACEMLWVAVGCGQACGVSCVSGKYVLCGVGWGALYIPWDACRMAWWACGTMMRWSVWGGVSVGWVGCVGDYYAFRCVGWGVCGMGGVSVGWN